jgi:alcohol dehydrogenase, propanol-preferring
MSTYRAFEVTGAHNFRLTHRELVEPQPGMVRIKVQACGICRTDVLAAEGLRADPESPIVPGHEIVGVVDAVGAGVRAWHVGDRVGVGFLGGHCGECQPCRRGDFVNCLDQPRTGTNVDGGYAEVVYARASGLARIPDGLDALDAAPLLCAGLTTFRALLQAGARPGALVAVQGLGGLGHLAVQYARSFGLRVAVVARGTAKAALAAELGAQHYIDSAAQDPAAELQALGGAAAIIATAASGASMSPLVGGLAPNGRLVVVGVAGDQMSVDPADLIFGTRTIMGTVTGSAIDNEDNLAYCLTNEVRSMNEILPWTEAPKAYARMLSGEARFRVVLDLAASA